MTSISAYDIVTYFMNVDPENPPTQQEIEQQFPGRKLMVSFDKKDKCLLVEGDIFAAKKTKHTTDIQIKNE